MARLFFLGTAAALPSATQDNTSLLVESNGSYLMIDCSGTPYRKLLQLGVDTDRLQHILITHHHIDHIYGLPSLVECLWIKGRAVPLHIYALASAMPVVETLLDMWELRNRFINQFPIHLHVIQGHEDEFLVETPDFTIRTTPTVHAVPSVATKLIFPSGKTFVYSSDTAPCKTLLDFARECDTFLAECTFCDADGELADITLHLNTAKYRDVAAEVGAAHTILIHHSDAGVCSRKLLQAELDNGKGFKGRLSMALDFESVALD